MAQRRERILAAAREIVAEQGTAGLSMRDLARKSRVTVPTVYNLVGGKDAVLMPRSRSRPRASSPASRRRAARGPSTASSPCTNPACAS